MIRVTWICHFHDDEIETYLKDCKKMNGFAPWISGLIKLFENDPEIELHIVAPHLGIKKDQSFVRNGVFYHFYSVGLPLLKKYTLSIFDVITNYYFLKRKVRGYILSIKPDIIHLHGAENAYYSSTILQFKRKYPILVTIQGFLRHTLIKKTYKIRKRLRVEERVLSEFSDYGVRTVPMMNEVKQLNSVARFYWHIYPVNIPDNLEPYHNARKIYDCIFFARISKDKGIEDLLDAIALIKPKMPDITLVITGDCENDYLQELKIKSKDLGIEPNIEWKGFIPSQKELFKLCSKAKISVLPTYHDILPGTIIESMFLKTAVVAYSVGGLPEINKNSEVIKLVPKGDIQTLSNAISNLLADNEYYANLTSSAVVTAYQLFGKENIKESIIDAYKNVMNYYDDATLLY
jgi:glycosyltransferase involved in cell wall biosynthesis